MMHKLGLVLVGAAAVAVVAAVVLEEPLSMIVSASLGGAWAVLVLTRA